MVVKCWLNDNLITQIQNWLKFTTPGWSTPSGAGWPSAPAAPWRAWTRTWAYHTGPSGTSSRTRLGPGQWPGIKKFNLTNLLRLSRLDESRWIHSILMKKCPSTCSLMTGTWPWFSSAAAGPPGSSSRPRPRVPQMTSGWPWSPYIRPKLWFWTGCLRTPCQSASGLLEISLSLGLRATWSGCWRPTTSFGSRPTL